MPFAVPFVFLARLLVIVCENKLLLYDLNTRKPYEVSRAVLDGKAPNCVAFLFRGGRFSPGGQPDPGNLMTSPVLAVGCADGVVRLLHLATLRVRGGQRGLERQQWACGARPGPVCVATVDVKACNTARVCGAVAVQVIGRLAGNHKAGITALLTLPSKAESRRSAEQQAAAAAAVSQQQQQQAGRGKTPRHSSERGAAHAAAEGPLVFVPSVDLVLAGDSSGGMFLWSPFTTPLGSADREVAPRVSFSGHSGEVWALCLTPGPEDAQVTAPKVFSAGDGGGEGAAQTGACVQAQTRGVHVCVPFRLDISRPQAVQQCTDVVVEPCQQLAPQTQRPAHLQPVMLLISCVLCAPCVLCVASCLVLPPVRC